MEPIVVCAQLNVCTYLQNLVSISQCMTILECMMDRWIQIPLPNILIINITLLVPVTSMKLYYSCPIFSPFTGGCFPIYILDYCNKKKQK